MSFGASLDKNKICQLVKNTPFNDFLELNRMAFLDLLPKNSESRCISIAIHLIKKYYPNIKWIISFADGCQCGDGTIYRASGFYLTGIKENFNLCKLPNGEVIHKMTLESNPTRPRPELNYKSYSAINNGTYNFRHYVEVVKGKILKGFQLRYIYFIDKNKIKDLTVPILPYKMIEELGAGMYKGVKKNACLVQEQNGDQPIEDGGATPTNTLQN